MMDMIFDVFGSGLDMNTPTYLYLFTMPDGSTQNLLLALLIYFTSLVITNNFT
jgi:hypothetical protein